jgi:diadenylate cyclase
LEFARGRANGSRIDGLAPGRARGGDAIENAMNRRRAILLAATSLLALAGCNPSAGGPTLGPTARAALEIGIFFVLFLGIFWFMRGTRGENILKGIATILLASFFALFYFAQVLSLERVNSLLEKLFSTSVIGLIIIFQPELRRGLVRLGENPFVKLFIRSEVNTIDEVVESVVRLAKKKVGALIAVEREISLGTYIEGGVKVDAEVRSELIDTIFFPGSALHDGAIVIQDQRIAAAGCLFPLTDNPSISKALGTRHRAAIGLTEETDAVTIVVSEETGQISVGVDGELHRNLDKEGLEGILRRLVVAGDGTVAKEETVPGEGSVR